MKFGLTLVASISLSGIGWVVPGVSHASDRELLAILDRFACDLERIVATTVSPTVVVHEVTCKRSERVLQVICLELEWRLQTPHREENER